MRLRPGQTLTLDTAGFERVDLLEELGAGGQGHVWKVRVVSASDTAAFYVLKHMRIDPDLDDEQRREYAQRIRREASVQVDSGYIVRCLGLTEAAKDNFFLLFPYAPGEDFETWIRENGQRPWPERKAVFLKILAGVQALHQARIIHRDLKPKNILILQHDETPKILDFGLAKYRGSEGLTEVGTIAGTDAYIAPEAFGWGGIKEVDERCDIYALGVMLYEMLMGHNPWRANHWDFGRFAYFLQEQQADGRNTYTNILDIDRKFDFQDDDTVADIIRQSTMFEPHLRFQTVDEMRQALYGMPVISQRGSLISRIPHTGDTSEIARQALQHEHAVNRHQSPPRKASKMPTDPPEKKHTHEASGCFWLSVFIVLAILASIAVLSVGAWSVYRWWSARQAISISPTPTPVVTATPRRTQPVSRPTAKPTARPIPTRTPQPRPTSTPRPRPTATSPPPTPRPTPSPTSRPTPTQTPLPTPTPTLSPTPVHRLDQEVVNDLNRILGTSGDSTPTATPETTATPTPEPDEETTATPTPEPDDQVDVETLEELLRKRE